MVAQLTPAQRTVADHLAHRQRELAYASAAQVARELGVSPSSVVRFAQLLGYDGWPALQAELRLQLYASRRLVDLAPESAEFLGQFVSAQSRNLAFLSSQAEAIEEAAGLLASARVVWLSGDRSSSFIAGYAAHHLRMLRPDVHLLEGGVANFSDKLLDASPRDALWLTSMSRYSRNSVALARHLERRVPIILLTDEATSPLIPYADTRVLFATESITSLHSDIAAYATAHALVLAVARQVPGARARLEQAEALWDEFELFHKED
ncbi:MAG: MurR/RpiR family transcriptional regulator [Dehalococcoidia bacterium]|nr:MurR/RpiR family transcriptional regulator [Dehalococcoidia bacterium]